eukprot:c4176_g1_i1.p1 GENE.c4176_g1_i1~~c4176_g1_i1.p1  ORF type:complete len:315 (+),score=58.85 c4176_g1_i1:60-1004(+)
MVETMTSSQNIWEPNNIHKFEELIQQDRRHCARSQYSPSRSRPQTREERPRSEKQIENAKWNRLINQKAMMDQVNEWQAAINKMNPFVQEAKVRANIRKHRYLEKVAQERTRALQLSASSASVSISSVIESDPKTSCTSCEINCNNEIRNPDCVNSTFEWIGDAKGVEMVLSTDWDVRHPLNQKKLGSWSFTCPVQQFSPVLFKFVVDGCWFTSPLYPIESSGPNHFNNIAIPILFVWSQGGKDVRICTEADNWRTQHEMKFCQQRQKFVSRMLLPAVRVLHFKFVVDGKWVISSDYASEWDGSFQNNVMRCQN